MCWIQFAFHASRSFISRSLFTHEFSFHLPLARSPARCPCRCHRPFPLATCAAERIHFFIFLFPTGDNYCNKLYKNKIAILARSNASCSMSNTWSTKKKQPLRSTFVSLVFYGIWDMCVCVFHRLSFTFCDSSDTAFLLRAAHAQRYKRWHVWFEWHLEEKKYSALFLRNRKRSRDFSSIVVSHI